MVIDVVADAAQFLDEAVEPVDGLLTIGGDDVVGHRGIRAGESGAALEAAGREQGKFRPGLGAAGELEEGVGGDHGHVRDGSDVGIVLFGIHDHRQCADAVGEADDDLDGVLGCAGRGGDHPALVLEEIRIGMAGPDLGLAGHWVAADEVDALREVFGGVKQCGGLGGAGVGDDGAFVDEGRDLLDQAVVGEDGRSEDDQASVADGVGEVALFFVDRADLLGLAGVTTLTVVANDLVEFDVGVLLECESDGRADQAGAEDCYLCHLSPPWGCCRAVVRPVVVAELVGLIVAGVGRGGRGLGGFRRIRRRPGARRIRGRSREWRGGGGWR